MKKYLDIQRIREEFLLGFQKGDQIVIQEKLDGANFSVKYDAETDSILSFSRNHPLTYDNTLRGAWSYAQTLKKELFKEVLGDNLILFGEWLVHHTVVYPEDKYNKAYFYDVYNEATEEYLPQSEVQKIIQRLGVLSVPVFYTGVLESWAVLEKYIGMTKMGGEMGEGVVIKNMTRLNDMSNHRTPFYIKCICAQFSEVVKHHHKEVPPELLEERDRQNELANTIVTKGRVTKMLCKFIDEGIIPEDWSNESISIIARHMGKRMFADCKKEESETVEEVGDAFGKLCNVISMRHVRTIWEDRQRKLMSAPVLEINYEDVDKYIFNNTTVE